MFDGAVREAGGGEGAAGRLAVTEAEIDAVEVPLAEVVGLLNAATGRLVALVAEALETGVWAQAGIRSPAHWLAWKAGISSRRAQRLVAMARRSADLPATTAALAAGALSEDQVTEIALHVPAAHDTEVAALARTATVAQVATVARRYSFTPPPGDQDPPVPEVTPAEVVDRNRVSFGYGDDGRWWLRADVDADLGALVETALVACRDAEWHDRHPDADPNAPAAGVSWADTLTRLGAAALTGLAGDRPAADHHQVILHVRADQPDASTYLHLGPAVPAPVRRYLSCDATVRWLLEDASGVALALGRRQRAFTAPQRTLIEDRYGGRCARPGCPRRRGLHLHHHQHWEDGGPTDLTNAVPLCPADHRLHHHGLLHITGDPARPDTLVFTDHHGRTLTPAADPRTPDPDTPLPHVAAGLAIPDARWQHPTGERLDPWTITLHQPATAA